MREIRTSGSEGGGIETNRYSLPLSNLRLAERVNQIEGAERQDVRLRRSGPWGGPVDRSTRQCGGHKARPYAMHFLFNFDEARD